jgi:hypothetical protein
VLFTVVVNPRLKAVPPLLAATTGVLLGRPFPPLPIMKPLFTTVNVSPAVPPDRAKPGVVLTVE